MLSINLVRKSLGERTNDVFIVDLLSISLFAENISHSFNRFAAILRYYQLVLSVISNQFGVDKPSVHSANTSDQPRAINQSSNTIAESSMMDVRSRDTVRLDSRLCG